MAKRLSILVALFLTQIAMIGCSESAYDQSKVNQEQKDMAAVNKQKDAAAPPGTGESR